MANSRVVRYCNTFHKWGLLNQSGRWQTELKSSTSVGASSKPSGRWQTLPKLWLWDCSHLLNHLGDGKWFCYMHLILDLILLNHLGDGKPTGRWKAIFDNLLNHLGDGKLTIAIALVLILLLNHLGDGKPNTYAPSSCHQIF